MSAEGTTGVRCSRRSRRAKSSDSRRASARYQRLVARRRSERTRLSDATTSGFRWWSAPGLTRENAGAWRKSRRDASSEERNDPAVDVPDEADLRT